MALSLLEDMVTTFRDRGTRYGWAEISASEEAIGLNKKCTARCEMVGVRSGLRGQL